MFPLLRSCVLSQIKPTSDSSELMKPSTLKAYGKVLSIGSSRMALSSSLAGSILEYLPVRQVLENHRNCSGAEFPGIGAWVRNRLANAALVEVSVNESNSRLSVIRPAYLTRKYDCVREVAFDERKN